MGPHKALPREDVLSLWCHVVSPCPQSPAHLWGGPGTEGGDVATVHFSTLETAAPQGLRSRVMPLRGGINALAQTTPDNAPRVCAVLCIANSLLGAQMVTPPCNLPPFVRPFPPLRGGWGRSQSDGSPSGGGGGGHHKSVP